MLIDPDPQTLNTTRRYGFQVTGPGETSLAGVFDGTETFRVVIWAGDSQTPVWQSDAAVAWAENQDLTVTESPIVELTVSRTDIQGVITAGIYNLQVVMNAGIDDIEVWSGQIRFVEAAGAAAALPVYATFEDLEDEYPGILDLQELGVDQTGFAEERAWARRKIDTALLARAQAELEQYDRLGVWDQTRRTALEDLRGLLDRNCLEVTSELRRICTLFTLGRILARQLGGDQVDSKAKQGVRFLAEAAWATLGYVARIDTDNDGIYELVIG